MQDMRASPEAIWAAGKRLAHFQLMFFAQAMPQADSRLYSLHVRFQAPHRALSADRQDKAHRCTDSGIVITRKIVIDRFADKRHKRSSNL